MAQTPYELATLVTFRKRLMIPLDQEHAYELAFAMEKIGCWNTRSER